MNWHRCYRAEPQLSRAVPDAGSQLLTSGLGIPCEASGALYTVDTRYMLVGQTNTLTLIHSPVWVFLALPRKEPVRLYRFPDPHQASPAEEGQGPT